MTRNLLKLVLASVMCTTTGTVALAQTSTPAAPAGGQPAAASSAFEDFVKQSKKPVDWMTWGADLRLRNEYFNNAQNLGDLDLKTPVAGKLVPSEFDYFRFRGRIWTAITPVTNLSLNARFSGEPREWMTASPSGQYGPRSGFEERYGILDIANVKWNNALNQPLTITAGRQDIQLGDSLNWWLVADGTPSDGSWTFFLDSIRVNYEAKDLKTKFDVAYIYQNALPDEWIPTLGESRDNSNPIYGARPYYLTEQNEQGVIVNGSNKSIKDTTIDGFFIYKRDQKVQSIANGDHADIYTIGGKVAGNPAEHWKYSAEGAYQFGRKQDPTVRAAYRNDINEFRDISAFGVNAKLTYFVKDKLNNQVGPIYEFLSGDDPSTKGKDEMFDILWGRWPRFSEMYIYSYINENGGKIAQLNNLHRIGLNWSIDPTKKMNFSATYSALLSNQKVPTRATLQAPAGNPELFSAFTPAGGGTFRGHYLQTILRYRFNDHLSAHLWGEFLWMGDYYTHRDLMSFLRAEALLTW